MRNRTYFLWCKNQWCLWCIRLLDNLLWSLHFISVCIQCYSVFKSTVLVIDSTHTCVFFLSGWICDLGEFSHVEFITSIRVSMFAVVLWDFIVDIFYLHCTIDFETCCYVKYTAFSLLNYLCESFHQTICLVIKYINLWYYKYDPSFNCTKNCNNIYEIPQGKKNIHAYKKLHVNLLISFS